MRHDDTDTGTLENEAFSRGPSGTRTRDLRIKRPSTKTALRSGKTEAAAPPENPPWNTGGTHETGSTASGLKIGARVRIVAGQAAGVEGVIVERWPSNFGGEPQWVVASGDLVRKRVLRADYLAVLP